MRRQQVELIVIKAVERVLSGRSNEDSRIEFKATWPDVSKVRQLAGHANSARSEEIIWIIGVDEKAGRLTNPESQDAAQWWAQMSKRFDERVAPELMDLVVPVGDSGAVTALLFQTDRSPYVITVPSGGAVEREVPMRDGTRTRSATRYELLRLLTPAANLPTFAVLDASLRLREEEGDKGLEGKVFGRVTLYIEQPVDASAFLPAHGMSGSVAAYKDGALHQSSLNLRVRDYRGEFKRVPSGMIWRSDGAMANGPTVCDISVSAVTGGGLPSPLLTADGYQLKTSFEVAGAERVIHLAVEFSDLVAGEMLGRPEVRAVYSAQQ
jgi:hypothetical protein